MVLHRNLLSDQAVGCPRSACGRIDGKFGRWGLIMPAVRFRPGKSSTLLTILLFPALISLGFWQLDRGAQKQRLAAQLAVNQKAPGFSLESATALNDPQQRGRTARAHGAYLQPSLLLDNRIRHGRSGYEILTPFRLRDGTRMLVARGWIAADPDRAKVPTVETPHDLDEIHGRLGKAPVSGIHLGGDASVEAVGPGLVRVQRLEAEVIARILGTAVPADVFYLDPGAPNGYDRDWPQVGDDIGKHQAYAVQWFAMAGVLLLLYLKINLQGTSP